MNIAIFGKACSGKTTLANELEQTFDYRAVSLAGNLKLAIHGAYGTLDKGKSVDITHEDGSTETISIRQALQRVGEAVRTIDRDFWLRWFDHETSLYYTHPLVVDDGRMPHEADFLRSKGWLIVKIEAPDEVRLERYERQFGRRPTLSELNHPTETRLDEIEFDYVLDGELDVEMTADLLMGLVEEHESEVSLLQEDV